MVCTKQFCSYRDRADDFAALNATVIGISSQDLASHEGFTAKHSLNVPLLADVDRRVARAYSATTPGIGTTARAAIVIDENGIVRHRHDHLLGSTTSRWTTSGRRSIRCPSQQRNKGGS